MKALFILLSLLTTGCVSNCSVKPTVPPKDTLRTYSSEEKKELIETIEVWNYDCVKPSFTGLEK